MRPGGSAMPWSCGHAGSRGAASQASQGFSRKTARLDSAACGRQASGKTFLVSVWFCGMTHGDTRVMFWVRGDGSRKPAIPWQGAHGQGSAGWPPRRVLRHQASSLLSILSCKMWCLHCPRDPGLKGSTAC